MSSDAAAILEQLELVQFERKRRDANSELRFKVELVKRYQQSRFIGTYQDLLDDPRYAAACRFFLDDLYGPEDRSVRDVQFARIVPTLCRLFPDDVVATVRSLARLHAVSEQLDSELAGHLAERSVTYADYSLAWKRTGRPDLRQLQLDLLLAVGRALQLYTQRPLMRQALRSMRFPAKVAGMADLQRFLERGFTIFGSMAKPDVFLAYIDERERNYAQILFND